MLAFVKYCAASLVAISAAALLCGLLQQWAVHGNPLAEVCATARCI